MPPAGGGAAPREAKMDVFWHKCTFFSYFETCFSCQKCSHTQLNGHKLRETTTTRSFAQFSPRVAPEIQIETEYIKHTPSIGTNTRHTHTRAGSRCPPGSCRVHQAAPCPPPTHLAAGVAAVVVFDRRLLLSRRRRRRLWLDLGRRALRRVGRPGRQRHAA